MLPNLLIVGAAKCGTTSLANFLKKSQSIFIPDIKECRFFSELDDSFNGLGAEAFINKGIRELSEYRELYSERNEKIRADCSNDYLYYADESIPRILKTLGPETKIIIVLRNPILRAFSNYNHHVRDGWEDLNFREALISEQARIDGSWAWSYHYFKVGLYHDAVKSYMDNFKNVKVILFEDLEKEIRKQSFYDFLEIEDDLVSIPFGKDNVSGRPKSLLLRDLLNKNTILKRSIKSFLEIVNLADFGLKLLKTLRSKNLSRTFISKKDFVELSNLYRKDISMLSSLIGKDLKNWLEYDRQNN